MRVRTSRRVGESQEQRRECLNQACGHRDTRLVPRADVFEREKSCSVQKNQSKLAASLLKYEREEQHGSG